MKEGLYKGEELIIRIQPDEGILQRIAMKEPGAGFYMGTMEMDFSYDQHDQETGDAYVRLLEDSLAGDPTLFTRSDAVDESWTYFDKILDYWKKHPETPLYGYLQEHGDERSGCVDQPQSCRMDKPVQESDTFQFIL